MANTSNPQELQEKLKEVLADKEFAKELLQIEMPEDVQTALEAKGIELSLDEIRQIREVLRKAADDEATQGELSEDELAEVAGGNELDQLFDTIGQVFKDAGIAIGNWFASW